MTWRTACVAAIAGAAPPGAPAEPGIVVADLLTPGAVASLDPEVAWGIAAARGGTLDHAAIVAGALGIPYVVGLGPALLSVAEGATLAVDGEAGEVAVEPDEAAKTAFDGAAPSGRRGARSARWHARPSRSSLDGRRIEVFANIGSAADADLAVANGAEGVGLLRTEFLYLGRTEPPDEDEQVEVADRDRPAPAKAGR